MVTVGISCGLNCSWFDPRRGKARQEFVDLIHQLATQLGLSCIFLLFLLFISYINIKIMLLNQYSLTIC